MFSLVGAIKHEINKVVVQYHYPGASNETLKAIVNFANGYHNKAHDSAEIIQYFRRDKPHRWVLYHHCFNLNHCLFIAGRRPYFHVYRHVLRQINLVLLNVYDKGCEEWPTRTIEAFLDKLLADTIPHPFSFINFPVLGQTDRVSRLSLQSVVDIPCVDKEIYYNFIKNMNEDVLTNIFFWVLMGGRIFFHGRNSTRICHSVIAATSMIMPLKYQELVITLLPSADYLQSPYPCIFGVTENMFIEAENQGFIDSGYLVVDLEENRCRCEGASAIETVPFPIREFLRRELRKLIKTARRQVKSVSLRNNPDVFEELAKNIGKAFRTVCAIILYDYPKCIELVDGRPTITAKSFVQVMKRKLPESDNFYFELFGKSHIRHFLARCTDDLGGMKTGRHKQKLYEEFEIVCQKLDQDELIQIALKADKKGSHLMRIAGQSRDVLQDLATRIHRKTKIHRIKKKKKLPPAQRSSVGRNQASSDPSLFNNANYASLCGSNKLIRCESNDILDCHEPHRAPDFSRGLEDSTSDSLEDLHDVCTSLYSGKSAEKHKKFSNFQPPRESRLMDVDAEMMAIKQRLEQEESCQNVKPKGATSVLERSKVFGAASCGKSVFRSTGDLLSNADRNISQSKPHGNSALHINVASDSSQLLGRESQLSGITASYVIGEKNANHFTEDCSHSVSEHSLSLSVNSSKRSGSTMSDYSLQPTSPVKSTPVANQIHTLSLHK